MADGQELPGANGLGDDAVVERLDVAEAAPRRWHVAGLVLVAAWFLWAAERTATRNWRDIWELDGELGGLSWLFPTTMTFAYVLLTAGTLLLAAMAWYGRAGATTWATTLIGAAAAASLLFGWRGHEGGWVAFAVAILLAAWVGSDRRLVAWDQAGGWYGSPPQRRIAAFIDGMASPLTNVSVIQLGMGAVAVGIVARVATIWTMDVHADGGTYAAMGHAWAQTGQFLMPWGEISNWLATDPAPSHHYPPAYPIYLGLVYKAFGFGLLQTKLASLAVSLAAIAVAWWTSQDLYGKYVGWAAAGFIALDPQLLWSTGTNFSESMVLIWFAFTMWGILKSLRHEPYILAAGTAAGLAYLTRSSVGIFFIVAGVGGFLWRFVSMRWRVFTNPWYLGAIAVFGTCVGAWVTRNIRTFGGWPDWDAPWATSMGDLASHAASHPSVIGAIFAAWLVGALVFYVGRPRDLPGAAQVSKPVYGAIVVAAFLFVAWLLAYLALQSSLFGSPPWHTSSYMEGVQETALADKAAWAETLAYKAPFFVLLFAPVFIWFVPELRASLRRILDEEESGLWLGVLLMTIIAWVVSSMFRVQEQTGMFWLDNRRYIVASILPLAWLLLRRVDWRLNRSKLRLTCAFVVLTAFLAITIASPVQFADNRATEALEPYLEEGMIVAHDVRMNKYIGYPYLPRHDITFTGYWTDRNPHLIITLDDEKEYPGFVLVDEWQQPFLNGRTQVARLYADVARVNIAR